MLNFLHPKPKIFGLSISDTALRIVQLEKGRLRKESIALEPGIIAGGKIKNRQKLSESLLKLRSHLGRKKDGIAAVISLPASQAQTKNFNIPQVGEKDLAATAVLNLQMASPLDMKNSYADWQKCGNEFLGAFARQDIVDSYLSVLKESGFEAAAVEFPALAIARLIKKYSSGLDAVRPQLAVLVSTEGLDFLILKNGQLYFNEFVSGAAIENFPNVLVQQLKKIQGLHNSNNLILITPALYPEIQKTLKKHFASLKVRPLALAQFPDLASSWYASLGSALRGEEENFQEKHINLMAAKTEEKFKEAEQRNFFKLWQKAVLATLGFLAAAFLAGAVTVFIVSAKLEKQASALLQSEASQEAAALQNQAKEFNLLVDKVLAAKAHANDLSWIFSELDVLARQNKIALTKVSADSSQNKVAVSGRSASEAAVLKFRDQLAAKETFKNVNLPLAEIITDKTGVSFNLTFEI